MVYLLIAFPLYINQDRPGDFPSPWKCDKFLSYFWDFISYHHQDRK